MSTDANARGARATLGHVRGLDGMHALSVPAIFAFHTGLHSPPGGFDGVDSFFVLSGFLITSLLVEESGGTGTILLRRTRPPAPTPRPPRVAHGPGLCHHRPPHGSRACPASRPACRRS